MIATESQEMRLPGMMETLEPVGHECPLSLEEWLRSSYGEIPWPPTLSPEKGERMGHGAPWAVLAAKMLRAPSFPFLFAERVGNHKSHQHQGLRKAPAFSRPIRPFGPTTNGNESAVQVRSSLRLISEPFARKGRKDGGRGATWAMLAAKVLRAPSFPFLFAERVGDHKSHQHQCLGKAPAFSRPIRPFGPTTKGSESAFQLPSSSGCQVRPSSRLTSDPSVPAVIHTLSDSDH